ncbi:aldo/keto reductase [Catellatospora tritici]|uniref:aldo/keto reductase n=1 Tax=Catellatospora tritici TaxID=2851566 RepID=UPI001C2D7E95|nr:aldo/keto reductase [Catellatospora tritici]MBV1849527.1 aldo/keto reductase [Catellatospora tritici]MBV1854099.1 aldo/keto reductase [Catellatospora tritici]
MTTRKLGRSGIEVSALGLGCWAIGGPLWGEDGQPYGWGEVDDAESVRAVHRALDLGVTFFDTASNYGAGHSERVLGRALAGRRGSVVVASKFGFTFAASKRLATGENGTPAYMLSCLDGILDRLGTDYLDLYQLHLGHLPLEEALDLVGPLEKLVAQGRIRAYGWSTDDPARAAAFAEAGPNCAAIQYDHSVLNDNAAMVDVLARYELAGINRGPLAMGLLTGKYHGLAGRIGGDDVRGKSPEWLKYFTDGVPTPQWAELVDRVRQALTADGRTLSQGALGWLLARSPWTLPIPGVRTVAQAEENFATLALGPLPEAAFAEVESLLAELR